MTPTSKQAALIVYLLPMTALVASIGVAAMPALHRSIDATHQQRRNADVEAQK